jgi:xanthosine utilization system XapX-like protein
MASRATRTVENLTDSRPTIRVGLWAALASAAIGILLALFQVQGWTVPTPLALALITLLLAVIAVSASMVAYEVIRAIRQYMEHRATSPSWVESTKPGVLDYEADGVRAMNRLTRELVKLGKDTRTLGKRLSGHAKRLGRLQNATAQKKQRAANRSAKSMNKSAVYIEKRVDLLRALVKDIDRNYAGFIGLLEINTDEDFEAAKTLRDILARNMAATTESAASVDGYRQTVQGTEAQNATRKVRVAADRLEQALGGVHSVLRNFEKSSAGLIRTFDAKLDEWQRRP